MSGENRENGGGKHISARNRCIIAGGRSYKFTPEDIAALDALAGTINPTEIVSGGAPGADSEGEKWAKAHGLPVHRFPANWRTLGIAAGPVRNQQMAEYADALIVFPGGRGTADMIRRAKQAGLKIYRRDPSRQLANPAQ